MDDALVMVGGRSFQMRAAAAPKARSPTVFSLVRGTMCSLLDDDERSRLRASLSAAQCRSLDRYAGAVLLRHRNTRTARRNLIQSGTRSQCRSRSSGEMWSYFPLSQTNRAAALSTDWSRSRSRPDTPAKLRPYSMTKRCYYHQRH